MSREDEIGMNDITEVSDLTRPSGNAKSRKRPPIEGSDSSNKKKRRESDENVFRKFLYVRTLNNDNKKKMTTVLGKFSGSEDHAIVTLERKPFSESDMPGILCKGSESKLVMKNDIYSTHELIPSQQYSGMKISLIYPATYKYIAKYTKQETRLIFESAEHYKNITLPRILSSPYKTIWVDNILEKKTESERIVFEDPDTETGFILLPDLKWDGKQVEELYLIAICHQNGIKSLRNLTASHLPLLRNIMEKGRKAIKEKYGLDHSQLRVYLHYQPSFYHLHVHFAHVNHDAPGIQVGRAHLLTDVIQNIEICPDYYQRVSLTVRATDKIHSSFEKERKGPKNETK